MDPITFPDKCEYRLTDANKSNKSNKKNRAINTNGYFDKVEKILKKAIEKLSLLFNTTSAEDKIKNAKINMIGGVGIANRAWKGESGKELWRGRYQFETITLWERDDQGKPLKELHIYANDLNSTYNEWAAKVDSGEIADTIDIGGKTIPNASARFDRYVERKMAGDPTFKKQMVQANVRYLNESELNCVKATFDSDKNIQQIGLDSPSQEQKRLPEGDYAFIIAENGRSGLQEQNIIDDRKEQALYLALKGNSKEGKIQHSSFMRSGKVASAGMMRVDHLGKIVSITQQSGHYLPGHEEMTSSLLFLKAHLNDEDFNKITLSANRYTGLMMKITMGINTVAKKQGYKLDLGMVEYSAKDWLEKHPNHG